MSGSKPKKPRKPRKPRKPGKPGREKSVFDIWHDLMGDEVYLYWADAVDPAQFDQPWNPALAIDEWLGLMASGEYASILCLRMIRETARRALNFLERARWGEKLDYSRFELFEGEPGSDPQTELGALVRSMRGRDSFAGMRADLEAVLALCRGVLG